MAGNSVDLNAIQDAAAINGADISLMERDVWKAAHVVAKNWWLSYGYDYVLSAIRTRLCKVIDGILFCLLILDCHNYFIAPSGVERKRSSNG
jgi:hypothetical protein